MRVMLQNQACRALRFARACCWTLRHLATVLSSVLQCNAVSQIVCSSCSSLQELCSTDNQEQSCSIFKQLPCSKLHERQASGPVGCMTCCASTCAWVQLLAPGMCARILCCSPPLVLVPRTGQILWTQLMASSTGLHSQSPWVAHQAITSQLRRHQQRQQQHTEHRIQSITYLSCFSNCTSWRRPESFVCCSISSALA